MKLQAISEKLNKMFSLLLIPSSSPHKFHERKDPWNNICFHEAPRYHDKEVQFVIPLNLQDLNNMTVFSFPKHVILKRWDYTTLGTWHSCSILEENVGVNWHSLYFRRRGNHHVTLWIWSRTSTWNLSNIHSGVSEHHTHTYENTHTHT